MAVIIPYVNDIKHAYAVNRNITNQNASTEFYQSLTYELDASLYNISDANEIKTIVEDNMDKYKKYIHTDYSAFFESTSTLTNKSIILKYINNYGR